jgi:hypothetical protein
MSLSEEKKKKILQIAAGTVEEGGFFNEPEFKKDIYNIFIIKKMVARFLRKGIINEKLLLNNIIIALNTFNVKETNEIFRLALGDDEFRVIKTFLLFLNSYDCDDSLEPHDIILNILQDMSERYRLCA